MITSVQSSFLEGWSRYFPGADLPLAFFYSDDERYAEYESKPSGHACMIARLRKVATGATVAWSHATLGCGGAVRYAGFDPSVREDFAAFLSCGVPGKFEGLRYRRSPDLVETWNRETDIPEAAGKYLVAKRFDRVEPSEQPEVVVFMASGHVLAGLFVLAGFRTSNVHSVISPQTSGCGAILAYPRAEQATPEPRAVLGMFDISARPFVDAASLSFAVPWERFVAMTEDMDASFLGTNDWSRLMR
jgi:Uncharacterised ArCR, COG2043